jgi:hypothetical protein
MIPFTSPEFQLELIQSHTDELIRQADDDRRARQAASRRERRAGRWPTIRRAARPARRFAS